MTCIFNALITVTEITINRFGFRANKRWNMALKAIKSWKMLEMRDHIVTGRNRIRKKIYLFVLQFILRKTVNKSDLRFGGNLSLM